MRVKQYLKAISSIVAAISSPAMAAEIEPTFPASTPTAILQETAAGTGQSENEASLTQFGRHGALTEREMQMARVAWTYFEKFYQPETGLVNSVGSYPSTTMWDTASYVSALVAAYSLELIDKREFDMRAHKLLHTLKTITLSKGEAPNKGYHTQTAEKVDYANQPADVGFSANDIGRLLVWMKILKDRAPYLSNTVDSVALRWNFCNMIGEDGFLYGSLITNEGDVRYVQEGRLGYEEYAAKGFALWGFDVPGALDPNPLAFAEVFGVRVPYDGRDPRVFKSQNYVLTEGYILEGLELGWDLPTGDRLTGGIATDGWRAEFASRIYLAQQRRYEQTGILTARSEHQVAGPPYFVYDAIFADGYAWNTMSPSHNYEPDHAAIAAKAAVGLWALWDTPYTDLLFESVAEIYDPERGYFEGVYENGDGIIDVQTANNNGIILAALLHKVEGPILQKTNQHAQYWDTAYRGLATRANRCLPDRLTPKPVCCNCQADVEPVIPLEEFKYCRPVITPDGVAATDCQPEEHRMVVPTIVKSAPAACAAPVGR